MREIGPEDIVAFLLAFIVIFQLGLLAIGKYNGIDIDAGVNKEIIIFIVGSLTSYITMGKNKTKNE